MDYSVWETKQTRRKTHMTNLLYSLMIFNERLEVFLLDCLNPVKRSSKWRKTTYLLSRDSGITPVPMRSQKNWWLVQSVNLRKSI